MELIFKCNHCGYTVPPLDDLCDNQCASCGSDDCERDFKDVGYMEEYRKSGHAQRMLAVHVKAEAEARRRYQPILDIGPQMQETYEILVDTSTIMAKWQWAADQKTAPTQDAYDRVCKANEEKRKLITELSAKLDSQVQAENSRYD